MSVLSYIYLLYFFLCNPKIFKGGFGQKVKKTKLKFEN